MKSILLKTGLCALATGVMSVSMLAADGVLIVQRTTRGGSTETGQVQIEKSRMRAEMTDPSGAKQGIVFDGARQVLDIINADRKTYSELTKADIDRLGGQVQDAMKQMQAAMANMPPAQRAQMEAMMRGRGMPMGAGAVKTEYRKVGTDKVGRWACDKYEVFQDGNKVSELCTVDPVALGFTMADSDVVRQMADMFSKLVPEGADQMFGVGRAEVQGFSGIPVKRVSMGAGSETTMEITEVSRQTFADAIFAVPAGYQKVDFAAGRGRGR